MPILVFGPHDPDEGIVGEQYALALIDDHHAFRQRVEGALHALRHDPARVQLLQRAPQEEEIADEAGACDEGDHGQDRDREAVDPPG